MAVSVTPLGSSNLESGNLWGAGWKVEWVVVPDGEEQVIREFNSTSQDIAIEIISGDVENIVFNKSGGINNNISIDFIVCTKTPSDKDPDGRRLRVHTPTGRISVEEREFEKCSSHIS